MTTDGEFYPDTAAKRSEVIAAAAKAAGVEPVDYTNIFEDVKSSDSFSGYLQALVSSGVISVDTKFRPNDNITREEMCKVLSTLLKLDFTNTNADILSVYTDSDNISDWARPYVGCAANAKLMIGVESNMFAPKGNVTKAQMAKLCGNIKTLLKGGQK